MAQPLLQVQNLLVSFTKNAAAGNAVNNISFNIAPGEILAIVGESGSGKSITALSLMQLLPPQAKTNGQLLFLNKEKHIVNLANIASSEINKMRGKDLAMIFQEPMTSLNPVLTCGSQVMEAVKLHQKVSSKTAWQKTVLLFEKVNLPDPETIMSRYPHQLSGGQKQRVMIAMAVSCSPLLLIADEPATALDVTVQKTILQLIKQLQQQTGMAVIFITHDLALVADIADNVLVMHNGQIIEQGKTTDVLYSPQQPYTKALMACRPVLHKRGERLPVISDFLNQMPPLSLPENVKTASIKIRSLNDDEAQKSMGQPEFRSAVNNTPAQTKLVETVLKVEHLKVYYPKKRLSLFTKETEPFKAVDDVSFTVNKGETAGLVGESGCGKTTLGRAILQLLSITSGNIILNGKNLPGLTKKQLMPVRKKLQIVFQDPYGSLNPRLTIGNAIMEPMKVHGVLNSNHQRKERVQQLLQKVNLSADYFNRYPHQFSGGQRQRICIARALALEPSFLIFDESVSALDVSVQAQVLNLINDLKKEFNFTSIFISHDLSVVRYISDRILVMSKGKIVEEGASDEVYLRPKHEYTKKLIEAIPGKGLLF